MQQGDILTITNNLKYPLPFSAISIDSDSSTIFYYYPENNKTEHYRGVFQELGAILEVPVSSTKHFKVDVYNVFEGKLPVTTFFIPYDYAKEVNFKKAE